MLIVDAQVHIWGSDTPERPWPEGRSKPHRPQSFTKDDLLKEVDATGVARVVIVPPSWEGDRNDLALEAARLHPDRFAVMGRPRAKPRPLGDWRGQLESAQPCARDPFLGSHRSCDRIDIIFDHLFVSWLPKHRGSEV